MHGLLLPYSKDFVWHQDPFQLLVRLNLGKFSSKGIFIGSNIKCSANIQLPKYTTAGFPIKATAVLSFLLFPPEYSSTFLSICFVKFKSFASRFVKAGISFGRMPRNSANNSNVSAPVRSSSSASNCGQYLKIEWNDKMR